MCARFIKPATYMPFLLKKNKEHVSQLSVKI